MARHLAKQGPGIYHKAASRRIERVRRCVIYYASKTFSSLWERPFFHEGTLCCRMDILYALEGLRTPFLNAVFSVLTYLGDQTVCIAAVLLLLWCFDKQKGYCLFLIATTGTAVNQLLKALFLIPRPWVKDPAFTIVESARAAATGYSFPSGHTQNVTAEFSAIALWAKRRWVTWLCAIIILLTGFSRMYLGVHTPLDVGVSLVVGLLTSLVCIRLFDRLRPGTIRGIILAAMALMLGYLLLAPKGSANVAEFDQHGLESAYSLAGAALGLSIAWWVEERHIRYDTHAPLLGQICKVVLGLAVILGLKAGLKAPIQQLFQGDPIGDGIRYCLIALFGGLVWPLTFPFWKKIGHSSKKMPKEDA